MNSKDLLFTADERDIASLPESCYTASIPDWTGVVFVWSADSFFPEKVVVNKMLFPWDLKGMKKQKKGLQSKKDCSP